MKKLVHLAFLTSAIIPQVHADPLVIYGNDDRQEVYEATAAHQLLAQSTAILISKFEMTREASKPGLVQLNQNTLKNWLESSLNNKSGKKLFSPEVEKAGAAGISFCEGTRFVDQPNPGMCSGFLIAPDLIVTAGHCVEMDDFCEDFKWVFDFNVDKTTQKAGVDVKEENIYSCKKVVSHSLNGMLGMDFGVVQLTRPVVGRKPLEIRSNTKIADKEELLVIGGPSGLPTKVAPGAAVRTNNHPNFFVANLDTFQGNSGSAVFNSATGVVEGILVRGEEDYVPNYQKMCVEANKCASDDCRGEDVSRMTSIPEVVLQKHLVSASVNGDLETLAKILALKTWVDFYTVDGQSALIKAAGVAQNASIKVLLANGADVNLQDAIGNSALHELAKVLNQTNADVLVTLVDAGAKIDARNLKGETALLVAGQKANLEAVKLLIAAGANKNAVDLNGENVLFSFLRQGNEKAVLELADMGVDTAGVQKTASKGLRVKLLLRKFAKN